MPVRAPKINCSADKCKSCLKVNALTIATIIGVVLGICLGVGMREANLSSVDIKYFNFPGEILLNMLKLIILPLIVCSLITGVAKLDQTASGKLGLRTVIYYLTSTFIAVILGIILVVTIKPGRIGKDNITRSDAKDGKINDPVDSILDLIRNCFPSNLVETTFQRYQTVKTSSTVNNVTVTTLSYEYKRGVNALGLIVFCLTFGIIIGRMGSKGGKGKLLVIFFDACNDAVMTMVHLVMWYAPVGIMFIVAAKIMGMNDTLILQQLGLYIATVVTGLIIHGFILLPLAYLIFVRKNPFSYMLGAAQALFTALATASSSATLPLTIRCLIENNKVDERVARFVLPIGATINMDGTALYEAVAAIFIAQINDIYLSFGQIVAVSVTATAASIGAAGVPEAGLVTLVIVLAAVGLPEEDIGYILAIDWMLDRFRTSVNVLGDCIGSAIVAKFSKDDLDKYDVKKKIEDRENYIDYEPDVTTTNGHGGQNNPSFELNSV